MNTETTRTEQQHWAEAVAECITDEQEALRIVGLYEDGEWQPAMLAIGRENLALKRDLTAARAEVEKLAAFKAFVHEFLDRNGVPTDPPGKMREEGCRVGQRLKYIADQREAARARIVELAAALDTLRDENIDKVMAMSDEQISALLRSEGRDPDDVAKLTRQVCTIAALRIRVAKLETALRQWRIDFGDSTCFEDMEARQFRDDTDALLSPSPEPTK